MKFYQFILLSFLLLFVSCSQRNPNNFTLISYGYAGMNFDGINFNYQKSEEFYKLSKKWGIQFESKGCVVNDSILNFIRENNNEAEKNIEEKFGKNWKEKFNNEVEKEFKKNKK